MGRRTSLEKDVAKGVEGLVSAGTVSPPVTSVPEEV